MSDVPDDENDQPLPEGAEQPSTFALLCNSPEPPQPFEVLQRLTDAGYKAEVISEDAPDTAVWARHLKIDNDARPVQVCCLPRDEEFTPWEWTPARWRDEEEYELARRSRWMLLVRMHYEPDDEPNEHFHAHLKLADVIADGLATACIDMNSFILRSKTTLHELAACKVAPAPEEMYQVHESPGGDIYWLHTRGLKRFSMPELELIGVPRESLHDALTAFQWLIAYILPVYIPEQGLDFSFGAEVAIRLAPLEDVLKQMDRSALGGRDDRKRTGLEGWRMVVCDQAKPVGIQGFLKSVQGDPIFWLSDEESARRAHLARVRFGHAAAAWYSSQYAHRRMAVKLGVPFNDNCDDLSASLNEEELPEGASREHMWFELQAIEGKSLVAKLESEPVYATYLKKGDTYHLPIHQLSEFNLTLDGQTYSPATIAELDQVTLRTGRGS
ncbi:MAG: DUF2314 domain-containing protein [Planctomycetes bacterium]|nr:DUF2314 domain-containing protein [Planctomycetota bacterium]